MTNIANILNQADARSVMHARCVYDEGNKMQDETEGSGEGGQYVQFLPAFFVRNVMRKTSSRQTGQLEARLRELRGGAFLGCDDRSERPQMFIFGSPSSPSPPLSSAH